PHENECEYYHAKHDEHDRCQPNANIFQQSHVTLDFLLEREWLLRGCYSLVKVLNLNSPSTGCTNPSTPVATGNLKFGCASGIAGRSLLNSAWISAHS